MRFPIRLFRGIPISAIVFDSKLGKKSKVQKHVSVLHSNIGRFTYVSEGSRIVYAEIGSFCSIGSNVIIGGGSHPIDFVSTSPVFVNGKNIFHFNFGNVKYNPFKKTIIGNDVWLGNNAIIIQGLTIGNGAIIGAGSVVTHDVPPYSIVAGVPAKIIRYRFSDEEIYKVSLSEWWNWSDDKLKSKGDLINDIEKFLGGD